MRKQAIAAASLYLQLGIALSSGQTTQPSPIQAAIDGVGLGGLVRVPIGWHVLTQPLNCRSKHGLTLEGEGPLSQLVAQFPPELRGAPLIDCTASSFTNIRNLGFVGTAGQSAACGILLARGANGAGGSHNTFDRLWFDGQWGVACVLNVAAECNEWRSCWFRNFAPGGHAFILTDAPGELAISSPLGPVLGWEENDGVHTFTACQFGVYGGTGREIALWIRDSGTISVIGGYFSAPATTATRPSAAAAVKSERLTTNGWNREITIQNCQVEATGAMRAFWVTGWTASVMLLNTTVDVGGPVVEATALCEDWLIRGGRHVSRADWDWGSRGERALYSFRDLRNSEIHCAWNQDHLQRDLVPGSIEAKRKYATVAVQISARNEGNVFRVKRDADVQVGARHRADLDQDGDVDAIDSALLQAAFNGPNRAPK